LDRLVPLDRRLVALDHEAELALVVGRDVVALVGQADTVPLALGLVQLLLGRVARAAGGEQARGGQRQQQSRVHGRVLLSRAVPGRDGSQDCTSAGPSATGPRRAATAGGGDGQGLSATGFSFRRRTASINLVDGPERSRPPAGPSRPPPRRARSCP